MPISNQKLIISGNRLELYQYSNPVRYDFIGHPKTFHKRKKVGITTERSLRSSKKNINQLLYSNAYQYNDFKPIFISYTFGKEITDLSQAQKHFTKYIKRFTYAIFKTKNSKLKYLGVPEIQKKREQKYGVGVWHFHIVYFNLPYIENIYDKIHKIWSHGYTRVKTINDTQHISLYLGKYLTKANFDPRLFGKKKYFTSRGLMRPLKIRDPNIINLIMDNIENKKKIYENDFKSIERNQKTHYEVYESDSISNLNLQT